MRRRVAVVVGTRPEGIKVAPVVLGMADHPALEPVLVNTVQHREMLDQVLTLFGLRPDHEVALQRTGSGLSELCARLLDTLDPLLAHLAPDAVLVQGDTTTALAAALAAFHRGIPVVHLEAGLRSGDPLLPFPEEMNRRLVTRLASVHLAATPANAATLLSEGVDPAAVHVTGNTVIDALHESLRRPVPFTDARVAAVADGDARVVLVTVHRRESWGAPMRGMAEALAAVARAEPDVRFVVPMHRNPTVREALVPVLGELDGVVLCEPLPYGEFCRLMARAHLLVTDSGGVQEEGPSLGRPVLVLRDTTERPEAVAAGTARLVGTDPPTIEAAVLGLLRDGRAHRAMAEAVNPYGDGRATGRVLAALVHHLDGGPRPQPFAPVTPPAPAVTAPAGTAPAGTVQPGR